MLVVKAEVSHYHMKKNNKLKIKNNKLKMKNNKLKINNNNFYLLPGRYILQSMNTDPESKMYQHVAKSFGLQQEKDHTLDMKYIPHASRWLIRHRRYSDLKVFNVA